MQRWSALALVGILLACAALLVLRVGPAAQRDASPVSSASATAPASSGSPAGALALDPPVAADLPALAEPAPLEEPGARPTGTLLPTGEVLDDLRRVPGVRSLTVEEQGQAQQVRVQADGDEELTGALLKALGDTPLGRVVTREPTLEDAYERLVEEQAEGRADG